MSTQRNNTENFYRDIMNKLCENIKEDFMSEGISEDVILEMKKVIPLLQYRYGLID
jgi:hypothetical protein